MVFKKGTLKVQLQNSFKSAIANFLCKIMLSTKAVSKAVEIPASRKITECTNFIMTTKTRSISNPN